MQFGSKGEVQSKWFTFAGAKLRLCATYPTVEQWQDYEVADMQRHIDTPKPLDKPVNNMGSYLEVNRKHGLALVCGVEFDGDVLDGWNEETWLDKVTNTGPVQPIVTDFAGFLFRGAAAVCDDGPAKTEGAS